MPTWTAVDLDKCGTDFLRDLMPYVASEAARIAIKQELNDRRREPLYTYDLRNRKLAATVAR